MTTSTTFAQTIRKHFNFETAHAPAVHPDQIICRKNGEVVIRGTFFYRHDGSADSWAQNVMDDLKNAGISFQWVSQRENWQAWPKDSYWEVIIQKGFGG